MSRFLRSLAFLALLVTGYWWWFGRAGSDAPATPLPLVVGQVDFLPRLMAGATPSKLLLVAPARTPATLLVFDPAGGPPSERPLPGLTSVQRILTTPDGALVLEAARLQVLDRDARPVGEPVSLAAVAPADWLDATVDDDGLAVVARERRSDAPAFAVHRYGLDGAARGPVARIEGVDALDRPCIAGLARGRLAVAWTRGDGPFEMVVAVVEPSGEIGAPQVAYTARPGGADYDCHAQGTVGRGAVVIWPDSSPGPWSVMAVELDRRGRPGRPWRVNARDRRDALGPSLPAGGAGRWAAWGHGIHWGLFARTGEGQVAVRSLREDAAPVKLFGTRGSVEAYAVAATAEALLVVGAVGRDGAYTLHAGVFPSR